NEMPNDNQIFRLTVVFNDKRVKESFEVEMTASKTMADLMQAIIANPNSNNLQAGTFTLWTVSMSLPEGFSNSSGVQNDVVSLAGQQFKRELGGKEVIGVAFDDEGSDESSDMHFIVIKRNE
ncbi:hypothetical protein BGW39_004277, partial [Mortierella sp. 14UC]